MFGVERHFQICIGHIMTGGFLRKPVHTVGQGSMCNSHEIENEFHFLLVCPVYNDYRANLFNSIRVSHEFNTMTMDEKFIFINKMYQKNLAKYICLSWERRKSIFYN